MSVLEELLQVRREIVELYHNWQDDPKDNGVDYAEGLGDALTIVHKAIQRVTDLNETK